MFTSKTGPLAWGDTCHVGTHMVSPSGVLSTQVSLYLLWQWLGMELLSPCDWLSMVSSPWDLCQHLPVADSIAPLWQWLGVVLYYPPVTGWAWCYIIPLWLVGHGVIPLWLVLLSPLKLDGHGVLSPCKWFGMVLLSPCNRLTGCYYPPVLVGHGIIIPPVTGWAWCYYPIWQWLGMMLISPWYWAWYIHIYIYILSLVTGRV